MGEGIAVALHGAGATAITVANRTADRGAALAARVGGISVGFERFAEALGSADVILTCATTDEPLLDGSLLSLSRSPGRELLIVDVGVPRNVAADAAEIDGVTLLDLDHLRDHAEHGRQHRLGEIDAVRSIIDVEIDRFGAQTTALQAAPLVTALRDHAESVRLAELARYRSRLASLDPEEFEVVQALTRGIVAKLLHQPSVRLKDQAGSPQGERNAAAISDLFDLG
jgi:glutamyl-tRNA reductase